VGLGTEADPDVGALVTALVTYFAAAVVAFPSVLAYGIDTAALWPFFVAGLIAPGASQIFLTLAVRHAGPSRAAIFMGTGPLISILIALTLLGEPFRPLLVIGTVLVVLGGITRRDRRRDISTRAALAFIPAGLLLALGYDALLEAFDRGRVSVVSPLAATGALWAVLLSALLIGRSEMIGRRTVVAGLLIVSGGALIGALR
jgi:drug/metabolite transporter (DMT)-like permease